jgi:hypothetical protein
VTELSISDHALIRFLERAGGLDLPALRGLMSHSLSRAAAAAAQVGVSAYTIRADGLTYVVRNGTVVTILGAHAVVYPDAPSAAAEEPPHEPA